MSFIFALKAQTGIAQKANRSRKPIFDIAVRTEKILIPLLGINLGIFGLRPELIRSSRLFTLAGFLFFMAKYVVEIPTEDTHTLFTLFDSLKIKFYPENDNEKAQLVCPICRTKLEGEVIGRNITNNGLITKLTVIEPPQKPLEPRTELEPNRNTWKQDFDHIRTYNGYGDAFHSMSLEELAEELAPILFSYDKLGEKLGQ